MAKRKKAKKMAARGASPRQIARQTGVNRSAARNIVRRAAPAPTPRPAPAPAPTPRSAPAKKISKAKGVKQALRIAGPNVSKKELKKIQKATGKSTSRILNQMTKQGSNLSSGAANMLAKQLQASPSAFGRNGLGDSKIAQTIRQMAGTPDYRSAKMRQMGLGPGATPGTGMMIGGTVIRPGGKVAVKKTPVQIAAQPDISTEPAPGGGGDGGGIDYGDGYGDFDPQSIIDALGAFEMPEIVMPEMPDFSSMFDDLSSAFDVGDPLQLAALGQAYGGNLMRARQRQRRTRSDYLRNRMNNMALGGIGQALAPMMIGGGLTL